MAKEPKTSGAVPGEPAKWKTEEVAPADLRVGDWFQLYGTEVARVTAIDAKSPEAGLVYDWKGTQVVGLKPGKAKERVTRILV